MKVVLDTNVVVSSYLASTGPPATIRTRWRAAAFDLVVSEPILSEYRRVLAHPRIVARHGMSAEEIAAAIEGFREYTILVEPTQSLRVVENDPDDDAFFEAAVAAEAAYIVSGDKQVLAVKQYRGIRVLTPQAFLAVLDESRAADA